MGESAGPRVARRPIPGGGTIHRSVGLVVLSRIIMGTGLINAIQIVRVSYGGEG